MPAETHPTSRLASAALAMGVRHGTTVYDGMCLAMAAGHGCGLVTADRRLHDACRLTGLAGLVAWIEDIPP